MLPITHDGYTLRPGRAEDAEAYYSQNYCPLDPELARLTGCKPSFTREEVVGFFLRGIADAERRWLLLVAPDGRIAGESLLTEIDGQTRSANFRIALFSPALRGKGLGTWMTRETLRLAFDGLRLHRVYLDVFSFNPRAERAYLAAGFTREGVLRDAIRDGDGYADDVLMSILEDEWRARESKTETGYKREAKKGSGDWSPGGVLGARPLTFPYREAIKQKVVRERSVT